MQSNEQQRNGSQRKEKQEFVNNKKQNRTRARRTSCRDQNHQTTKNWQKHTCTTDEQNSNLQQQKNENHELETTASCQNAKQQNMYIEDGSQLKTKAKSETEEDIKIKKKQWKPSIN